MEHSDLKKVLEKIVHEESLSLFDLFVLLDSEDLQLDVKRILKWGTRLELRF